MKVKVYRYGRYSASIDDYIMVGEWMATIETIAALNADPRGDPVEVDDGDLVGGRWVSCSLTR